MKIFLRTALLPLVTFFGIQVASAATVDEFECSVKIIDENQVVLAEASAVATAARLPIPAREGIEFTAAAFSLAAKVSHPVLTPEEPVPPQPIPEPNPGTEKTIPKAGESKLRLHYRHALETDVLNRKGRAAQSLCLSAMRQWKGHGEGTDCAVADVNPFEPNSYGWTRVGTDNGVALFEPSQLRRVVLGNPVGERSEYECRFRRTLN